MPTAKTNNTDRLASPRRVIHCARRFAPSKGGVETHLAALVKLHLAQSDQVTIITEQADQSWPLKEERKNLTIIRLQPPFSKLSIWSQIWQLRSRFQQADLVQTHDVGWWLVPVWPFIRSQFFITFHGWEGQWPVRWQAKLHRWLISKLARGTIHVGKWIQEFYWDRPTMITYGGVWPEEITSRPKLISQSKRKLRIAFIGRLEAENEIAAYVDFLKNLKFKKVPFQMTWLGDGSLKPLAAEYGRVTGMLSQSALMDRISEADLILANSYLAIWQALAAGKLVAAVASQPLKQRYLETFPAFKSLATAKSGQELAHELAYVLADSNRVANKIKSGLKEAKKHTWPDVFNQYQQLWMRVDNE